MIRYIKFVGSYQNFTRNNKQVEQDARYKINIKYKPTIYIYILAMKNIEKEVKNTSIIVLNK